MLAEAARSRRASLCGHHAPAALSHGQSNPGLATVGKFDASSFENLTNAGDGAGAYFFASLEANDCLGSDPCGGR